MLKTIKQGKNLGIAEQVQGKTVDAIPHPQWKNLWSFEFNNEMWVASDNAFVD